MSNESNEYTMQIGTAQEGTVDDYNEATDKAASIILHKSNFKPTSWVPPSTIDQALIDGGIPINIIQSTNPIDKNLVNDLRNIVRQKLKSLVVDDYNEATDKAVSNIWYDNDLPISRVLLSTIDRALIDGGIPVNIIQSTNPVDKNLVNDLRNIVRQKLCSQSHHQYSQQGTSVDDYNEATNKAVSIMRNDNDLPISRVLLSTIDRALIDGGIPVNIIQSTNPVDKNLVNDLRNIVRQKLCSQSHHQYSQQGTSVDDYNEATNKAVSIMRNDNDLPISRVLLSTIDQALIDGGIPVNIIQSTNPVDKNLVNDLRNIVRQKLCSQSHHQYSQQGTSVDDYNEATNKAVSIMRNDNDLPISRVLLSTIDQALIDGGIPVNIIQSTNPVDKNLVNDLRNIVRQKLCSQSHHQYSQQGTSVDDYNEATDKAASIMRNDNDLPISRVLLSTIDQALIDGGIPINIIQSTNPFDKNLVNDLRNIVRQKLCSQSHHQYSQQGTSVDDYSEATDKAVSIMRNDNDLPISRVLLSAIDQALIDGGIPVNIIQSTNPVDKNLVNDLRNIVRQKLKKNETTEEKVRKARRYANRMAYTERKGVFQAPVCIICDSHIIGTEEIHLLTKARLEKKDVADRIGVDSYNKFYSVEHNFPELPSGLIEQYEVDGLEGLLLSKRSRLRNVGGMVAYEACLSCYNSIKMKYKLPPKFAIANGYVIGQIPEAFEISDKDGTKKKVVVDKDKITDIVRAMLAPTRAYGYTFSYFAGAQQSIQGHYVFYEVDQTHVGSVLSNIQVLGANPHVHIVLGGRFTPSQKTILRKKTAVDTTLVTDLLTWFIEKSGHKGFEGYIKPSESDCPPPKIDEEVEEDFEVDQETERQFDGGTYYFSSANVPSSDTGVCGTQLKFAKSLLERTPPTLLAYGGDYVSGQSLKLENIIPTAFPHGIGGPDMPRRNRVSLEACLKHYGRLSLPQFMRGDFCLLASHMLDRRLSYTSGKVKCRSNIDGMPLAEKVSMLTVKDLEDVITGANTNSTAIQLLSSVSVSCKAVGHTSEAAAYWRRVYFALNDRHGLNPFMLTITPNDLANFSVRVIAYAGEKHTMPSLDSSDEQCIADFNLRKKTRLDFPGACSLNFQSVMQIVLKVLLAWNSDEQKGSEDGIFGELDAWGMAVEEQARKTLHSHWLLWSKRLAKMREDLFDADGRMNEMAKADFCKRIDKVLSASYTDNEWTVEHACGARGKVGEIIKECNLQKLRDSRHKDLCQDIKGKVMECKECHEPVSTQDIINLALNEWHQNALKDENSNVKNLTIPLSKERHDIAMYRTSYDLFSDCNKDDLFWGNNNVRKILQISGDNEHYALHGPRCFKKGKECTSGTFPQAYNGNTDIIVDESAPELEWYLLDGSIKRRAPWLLLPKRPLGCQYLNTHNVPISTIFNCNSNVVIGDASNTFYLTCYGSKSTQKEDKEKKERILKKLIRRLKRLQTEREQSLDDEENQSDFGQGLSMMLSAMNASTSRDVVSSPMAHYLVQNGGSRFKASHEPEHLLIDQLEATLNGKAINFTLRRTNKSKVDGTIVQWPDSSSHDYLYRPSNPVNNMSIDDVDFDNMCAYEFTEKYKKKFYSFKDMDDDKQDTIASGKSAFVV